MKIVDIFKKSAFAKNLFIVMSGTAVAQIIAFALTPIISRFFSPADFGIFGSFDAILTIIVSGVTLDYSQAVMLAKEKEDAFNIFLISCGAAVLISALCLVFCLLTPKIIQSIIKETNAWALSMLVGAVLVRGINQACQAWCVRVKAFKNTSASQVIRSLSSSGMQIGLGYLKFGPIGLIFSLLFADVMASINLGKVVFRDMRALRINICWPNIKRLIRDYRDFPIYSASMNLINSLSMGLPVLLLTQFYGVAVAGAYAFGDRVLSAPMGFVQIALRQVLFQKAAEIHNEGGRVGPLYTKMTLSLFFIAIPPSLIMFIWAPYLFNWIFGPQWQFAGEFARYLIIWLLFMFCNLPSVLFARVIRIQREMFIFNMVLLGARGLTLTLGGIYLEALHTIIIFAIVGAIMNIIFIIYVGHELEKREGESSSEYCNEYESFVSK